MDSCLYRVDENMTASTYSLNKIPERNLETVLSQSVQSIPLYLMPRPNSVAGKTFFFNWPFYRRIYWNESKFCFNRIFHSSSLTKLFFCVWVICTCISFWTWLWIWISSYSSGYLVLLPKCVTACIKSEVKPIKFIIEFLTVLFSHPKSLKIFQFEVFENSSVKKRFKINVYFSRNCVIRNCHP